MDLGLTGKRAIVTGGTRGIGRAIAQHLAADGCNVAVCARTEAAIPGVVAHLQSMGVTATGGAVDVRDGAALRTWIGSAAETLGGLDILVANVSGFGTTLDEDGWRSGFDSDILGTFHAVEAALPIIENSGAGALVAIASTAALEFFGGVRPYNAIKAAVINYMSNLAVELAPKGIRANTVSPGTIYFEGGVWHQREQNSPEIFQRALAHNPSGRMGRPDEVAKAAVFLASPAASFVTGANLVVDGALTRRVQY